MDHRTHLKQSDNLERSGCSQILHSGQDQIVLLGNWDLTSFLQYEHFLKLVK